MKLIILLTLGLFSLQALAEWKFETIAGVQVHYYLPKIPLSLSVKTKKKSLMINLHGCSQKAEDLKKDGNWESTADDFNMIVALPKVPNGGVLAGCWDYYGGDHTVNNRHNGALINLTKALIARGDLNIDPGQVYLSGLSSGGGQSMILGCLAPELYAGLGINAGPSTGTASSEISRPKTSYETMLNTCKNLANGKEQFFKTQIASIIYGNNDYIVSTNFNLFNADILKTIYGAPNQSSFDTLTLDGANKEGTGTLWSDAAGPRVSLIMNKNLGHNWPAGQGGNGGNFINKKSLNYPQYLAQFFYTNNRRSSEVRLPEVLLEPVVATGLQFQVAGSITIPKEFFKSLNVVVVDKKTGKTVDRFPVVIGRDRRFSAFSRELTMGEYIFKFEVKNTFGGTRIFTRNSWLGEVEGMNRPQLVNTKIQVVQSCLILSGQAVNNGIDKVFEVNIALNKEKFLAPVINTFWDFKLCDLTSTQHELQVFAVNESGVQSNIFEAEFTASDRTAWASLQEHMEANRLDWNDFGAFYLRYGNQKFLLYLGDDQIWRDQFLNNFLKQWNNLEKME